MKSLPLAYNKDMQEDKEAIFDSIDTLKICLPVFSRMLSTIKIKKENMYKAAQGGFTNATDLADYLVKKGMAFRNAHEVVGKMVLYCIEKGVSIDQLSLEELKSFSGIIENDIYADISLEKCISGRNVPGGPAKEWVQKSIENGRRYLSLLSL